MAAPDLVMTERSQRNSWHAGVSRRSLSPDQGERSSSTKPRMGGGKEGGEDSGQFSSPSDIPDSPEVSPVSYRPISRNHSLRYSGGALHHTDQPVSFDHNFDRAERDNIYKAKSSSPPRRPTRRGSRRDSEGEPESALTVKHLARQRPLPPLVRVQADLAAENGAR